MKAGASASIASELSKASVGDVDSFLRRLSAEQREAISVALAEPTCKRDEADNAAEPTVTVAVHEQFGVDDLLAALELPTENYESNADHLFGGGTADIAQSTTLDPALPFADNKPRAHVAVTAAHANPLEPRRTKDFECYSDPGSDAVSLPDEKDWEDPDAGQMKAETLIVSCADTGSHMLSLQLPAFSEYEPSVRPLTMGWVRKKIGDKVAIRQADLVNGKLLIDGREFTDEEELPVTTCKVLSVLFAQPQPGEIKVEVLTGGGELILTCILTNGKAAELKTQLISAGVSFVNRDNQMIQGENVLADGSAIQQPADGSAATVTLVMGELKPPPKPASPARCRSRSNSPAFGKYTNSNCFTSDSVALVLDKSKESPRLVEDLCVGDMVATGAHSPAERYRRVTRLWPSRVRGGKTEIVQLSPGLRMTPNHPVLAGDHWRRAGSLREAVLSPEEYVYGIELEGHVDTILLGGIVCAALGVYCGSEFGWNIFTRRTTYCDAPGCPKCQVAVDTSIDFASTELLDLQLQYAPY